MYNRRDIPPEDRYGGGGGQSYRPGAARNYSPHRDHDSNGYGRRSPPRRPFDARGPPRARSRSPPRRDDFRRRSPSPRRGFAPRGADTYRTFQRSPPRRDDLERDDLFRGDQRRDMRDDRDFRARDDRSFAPLSPRYRDRSPLPGRGRGSPMGHRRTPPGPRRDRSPPRRFDDFGSRPTSPPRRDYSPPRGPARDYGARPRSPLRRQDQPDRRDDWRRRSPSPRGPRQEREHENNGGESIATSRRSSPPVHASRLALLKDNEDSSSGRPSPRSNHDDRDRPSPGVRTNFASPRRDRDGDVQMDGARPPDRKVEEEPVNNVPAGPVADRPPPTGPAAGVSGVPRPVLAPPSGPRGDQGGVRGGFAPRGRGGFSADYSSRGRGGYGAAGRGAPTPATAPAFPRGASFEREPRNQAPAPAARTLPGPPHRPTALRTTSNLSQRFDNTSPEISTPKELRSSSTATHSPSVPYRRPTEPSTIPSGPASDRQRESRRTDDAVHPALRGLPEIVPGGKKLPPVVDRSRLAKLEEDSDKLRRAVYDVEIQKRKSLHEWDRLTRESESVTYRSELAEAALRSFDTDGDRVGAAF